MHGPISFAPLPPDSMTEATRHGWPYEVQSEVRKRFYRRGGAAPEEAHRVFYLGTHRSGWLAAEPGKDVPADVLAQWLAKVNVPLFISRRQLEKRKVPASVLAAMTAPVRGGTLLSRTVPVPPRTCARGWTVTS